MRKLLLSLLLLFITVSLYAEAKFNDPRLLRYPEAKQWSKDADTNGESAYNIGVLYREVIKDNNKAIEWYKKAYSLNHKEARINASINLASIYRELHQFHDAIFYYRKAYEFGDVDGANGLGYLYQYDLNDDKNAELWYKKAVAKNHQKAIGNLAKLYHKQKKVNLGSAYLISLIENGYPKQKVLAYLKTKWNLTDEEIKKAYQLQKTLDIPKHYYDPEFEDTSPKKKTGRR